MNILLWIVQALLALLSFAGGAYKIFGYAELAKMPATAALSRGTWGALGAFEMACGVLLIVPTLAKWMPALTPTAAVAIGLESLLLAVLYARHSMQLTASNPLVWVVLMILLAVIVAFGRSR